MGLKTLSQDSEFQAIRSMCDGDDVVKGHLIAVLTEEHFAVEETKELFLRITGMARHHNIVPSVRVLQNDPAVSEDARDLLQLGDDRVHSLEEAEALFDQLDMYRKLRIIYLGTRDVVNNIKEASPTVVERSLVALEKISLQARCSDKDLTVIRSGENSNAKPIIDAVLSEDPPDRILTGFGRFDQASGGFARQDLVLIAATTGGGKSVMAEQLAINAYLTGNRRTCLVSLEMDQQEIHSRLLSNLTEISFGKIFRHNISAVQRIRARKAWEAFTRHGEENGCCFDVLCPTFDVTAEALAKSLMPRAYDIVLIDYVGLVGRGDKNKQLHEVLGEITATFKNFARATNAVAVVLAQLDEDSNKVKYSKAMKHHSSYVWTWNYGEEERESGRVTVDQIKTRHCESFPFDVLANMSIMQFLDVDGPMIPSEFLGLGNRRPPQEMSPDAVRQELTAASRLARQMDAVEIPMDDQDL